LLDFPNMDPPLAIKHDDALAVPTVAPDAAGPKQNLARILFVHCSAADVQRYAHELERVRFTVIPDSIVTPERFAERLHSRSFDLILAEHPSLGWQETQMLELLDPRAAEKRHPSHLLGPRLETRDGCGVHPERCSRLYRGGQHWANAIAPKRSCDIRRRVIGPWRGI
jgi:hypothetical protein